MAPASPELGIIMRLWALSKGALMTQHQDPEGKWCEGGQGPGKRKQRGKCPDRGEKGLHVGEGYMGATGQNIRHNQSAQDRTGSFTISYKIQRM